MPLLRRSLRTEAPECEIQIIITARQFHYLGEGYVALAHIGCLPCVKGKRKRGAMGAKASPLWPWQCVCVSVCVFIMTASVFPTKVPPTHP